MLTYYLEIPIGALCVARIFLVFGTIKHLRQLKDGGFGTGENEKQQIIYFYL